MCGGRARCGRAGREAVTLTSRWRAGLVCDHLEVDLFQAAGASEACRDRIVLPSSCLLKVAVCTPL